ncbi:hypothetical protein COP2_007982 [Malus domestica]
MREEKMGSQQILPNILKSDFPGLSGKVQFANRAIAPVYTFQIINVMEGSHIELGFSETMGESATLSSSMKDLARKVYWPGGARYTPLGWSPPTSANPLRIGVPTRSHKSLQWICDIWLIERNHCPELKGSIQNQIGIWLAFNPLFSLNGKQVKQQFVADFNGPVALRNKLSSNLSRIAMVMWLFMALVITQTYTANLASLLTLPQLEPVATVVVALHDAFIHISIGFLSQMVIEIDSHHQDGP